MEFIMKLFILLFSFAAVHAQEAYYSYYSDYSDYYSPAQVIDHEYTELSDYYVDAINEEFYMDNHASDTAHTNANPSIWDMLSNPKSAQQSGSTPSAQDIANEIIEFQNMYKNHPELYGASTTNVQHKPMTLEEPPVHHAKKDKHHDKKDDCTVSSEKPKRAIVRRHVARPPARPHRNASEPADFIILIEEWANKILAPSLPHLIAPNKMNMLPFAEQHMIKLALKDYFEDTHKYELELYPAVKEVQNQKAYLQLQLKTLLSKNDPTLSENVKMLLKVIAEKDIMLENLSIVHIQQQEAFYNTLKLRITTILNDWIKKEIIKNPYYVEDFLTVTFEN